MILEGRRLDHSSDTYSDYQEGVLTILLGIFTWFFAPGFPDTNNFLDANQTALVLQRIDKDRGDALPDKITLQRVWEHLLDWKVWAYGVLYTCAVIPNQAAG